MPACINSTKMMPTIKFMVVTLLLLLSGCRVENLPQLIDISEKQGKPCILGVWPAVKSGNKKYQMNEKSAFKFVRNVQTAVGSRRKYKRIKASRQIPYTCKKLLWHNRSDVLTSYLKCMATWGIKSLKQHEAICPKDKTGTYVIGAAVSSNNGRAKVLIVNLDKPKKFANKRERYTSGKDLNRLARNIGRAIRRELK
jgi:hypothetical protein